MTTNTLIGFGTVDFYWSQDKCSDTYEKKETRKFTPSKEEGKNKSMSTSSKDRPFFLIKTQAHIRFVVFDKITQKGSWTSIEKTFQPNILASINFTLGDLMIPMTGGGFKFPNNKCFAYKNMNLFLVNSTVSQLLDTLKKQFKSFVVQDVVLPDQFQNLQKSKDKDKEKEQLANKLDLDLDLTENFLDFTLETPPQFTQFKFDRNIPGLCNPVKIVKKGRAYDALLDVLNEMLKYRIPKDMIERIAIAISKSNSRESQFQLVKGVITLKNTAATITPTEQQLTQTMKEIQAVLEDIYITPQNPPPPPFPDSLKQAVSNFIGVMYQLKEGKYNLCFNNMLYYLLSA